MRTRILKSKPGPFLFTIAAPLLLPLASALGEPIAAGAPPSEAAKISGAIAKGKETYAMFCQPCHGAEDAGIDSPSNLFDSKWYHGEGRESVEYSIRNGIMEKGMPAWGQMISDEEIRAVTDYLLSLQTSDPSETNA